MGRRTGTVQHRMGIPNFILFLSFFFSPFFFPLSFGEFLRLVENSDSLPFMFRQTNERDRIRTRGYKRCAGEAEIRSKHRHRSPCQNWEGGILLGSDDDKKIDTVRGRGFAWSYSTEVQRPRACCVDAAGENRTRPVKDP